MRLYGALTPGFTHATADGESPEKIIVGQNWARSACNARFYISVERTSAGLPMLAVLDGPALNELHIAVGLTPKCKHCRKQMELDRKEAHA